MKHYGLLVILILLIGACTNNKSLEGLWVVEKVVVGEEENTPNARWTRFNADGTQQSGNGWFRHSVGTWTMDKDSQKLSIQNSNGVKDTSEPFEIELSGDNMSWTRNEEGRLVRVQLKRAKELPLSYGDRVLGLWDLEESSGEGPYLIDKTQEAVLFLKWDRRFMLTTPEGQLHGVYNVHGHRPEIELIPYGEKLDRNFWSFEWTDNSLTLHLLNSKEKVIRKFIRTDQFPE